jgi:ketosteroid isomerase-like protein
MPELLLWFYGVSRLASQQTCTTSVQAAPYCGIPRPLTNGEHTMTDDNTAVQIVSNFLAASMAPDPVKAATFMSADVRITFTGGRAMPDPQTITAFNGSRYAWVKKALGNFDWMDRGDHTVVYSNGTLYGEWQDGRSFSGNRYLDRFEVRDGKITHMDVWNDSAEWILAPELNRS